MNTLKLLLLFFILLLTPNTFAKGVGRETGLTIPRFVTLKSTEVNLRKGPGKKYKTIYIYKCLGYPVEVIAEFSNWRKIRDKDNTEGWLHEGLITGRRNVIIIGNKILSRKSLLYKIPDFQAVLFKAPDENSNIIARVEFNVVAKLMACQKEWCKISVKDSKTNSIIGWIRKINIWGIKDDEQFK